MTITDVRTGFRAAGRTRHTSDDQGFGLIEVMVSMFLLALLAVAFLPTLVQGLRGSVQNSTVATASQLLGEQLDRLREIGDTCSQVTPFDDVAPATTTDARGTVFQAHRLVAACPSTYPGVVRVTAWVTKSGDTRRIAEAETFFYVKTATP